MTDREGAADNVALITFARYPQLLVPFTLDVDALEGFLEDVRMVDRGRGPRLLGAGDQMIEQDAEAAARAREEVDRKTRAGTGRGAAE